MWATDQGEGWEQQAPSFPVPWADHNAALQQPAPQSPLLPAVLWGSQKTHTDRGLLHRPGFFLTNTSSGPHRCLEWFSIGKPFRQGYWCRQKIVERVHGAASGSCITHKLQSKSSKPKYIYTNPPVKKSLHGCMQPQNRRNYWTFPSAFLSYLDCRHVMNYSLSSFKDFVCLHKKSKAHTLPQNSCPISLEWSSYDNPTTSMTPCIHHQIVLSADSLTGLSVPCLFEMQKLLLYHQLQWLPRLLLMLSVLHQNLQTALFNSFQHDRMMASLMVCWAVRPPAPNTDPFTSLCTGNSGTALPKSSLPRLRRQTPAPNPRQRANKTWPILQQFSKGS